MTQDLFRQDAYLRQTDATVTAVTPHGIVLDRTVFYPLGGGQAGDTGWLLLADGQRLQIADTRKGKDDEGRPPPPSAICRRRARTRCWPGWRPARRWSPKSTGSAGTG